MKKVFKIDCPRCKGIIKFSSEKPKQKIDFSKGKDIEGDKVEVEFDVKLKLGEAKCKCGHVMKIPFLG